MVTDDEADLQRGLASLTQRFSRISARLAEAGQALIDHHSLPDEPLIRDILAVREAFDALRSRALQMAASLSIPLGGPIRGLADLDSAVGTVLAAASRVRPSADGQAPERQPGPDGAARGDAEAARKVAGEGRRQAEEEALRKGAEEARRRAEAERRAAEEARRRAEEDRHKAAEGARRKAEEEARRKAEEEAKRKAAEEARRKAEEDRQKAAEEAKRKAAEEARRKAEEEARRKSAEEAKRRAEAEAEAQRQAAEEARRKAEEDRQKAAEEAKRKAAEEARRKAEDDAKRKGEEQAKPITEEARRKALEEARRKLEEVKRRVEPPVPAAVAGAEGSEGLETAQWWISASAAWGNLKSRQVRFADAVRDVLGKYPYVFSVPVQTSTEYEDGLLAYGFAVLLEHVDQQVSGFVADALNRLPARKGASFGRRLYEYLAEPLKTRYGDFVKAAMEAGLPKPGLWVNGGLDETETETTVFQRASARIGDTTQKAERLSQDRARFADHHFSAVVAPLTARFFRIEASGVKDPRDVEIRMAEKGVPSDLGWIAVLTTRDAAPQVQRQHRQGTLVPGLGRDCVASWIGLFNPDPDGDRRIELAVTLRRRGPAAASAFRRR